MSTIAATGPAAQHDERMRRPGAVLNAAAHEVVGLIASSVQRYLTADVAELGLPARYRA